MEPQAVLHPPMHAFSGMENMGFDKLPLNDTEFGRSPLNSLYPSQLMSPLSLGGSKFNYGSPQGLLKFPCPYGITPTPCAPNQPGSNCNKLLGSPLNCPPTFGAYMEFTSFAGVTPCNNSTNPNYNLPNSIFGSGNCSPCFPTNLCNIQMQGLTSDNALCKSEDKDN